MDKFNGMISSYDTYLFHEGNHFNCYKFLGAHLKTEDGVSGVNFCLWAPNAKSVKVVGDFNNWQGKDYEMVKSKDSGLWSIFIPDLGVGHIYKYEIETADGQKLVKADPYAFYSELRPDTASKVVDLNTYQWNDEKWFNLREKNNPYDSALNIYEVHLGSWKVHENGDLYTYRELADELVDYAADMGYTHIEVLPVNEHPLDASWGYQATGYYSVTSRMGEPQDFMYLVDKCHEKGLGIILDWVPGHFCKDAHGLYRFDGTTLYEYKDPKLGENYDWGTANFDLGKPEVQSFLISNALFWFEMYHIDGLRVDAVANMIYLDYGQRHKYAMRNKYGRNENIEAVEFVKKMNKAIFEKVNNPLVIAEESTSWPLVTAPTYIGGLGFNYKWNMGWMNDMLKYMEMDPIYRKWHHNLITFSFMYAFSENFVLPLSHDEVVHGKKSLLNKMPGDYWQKFANLRLFYAYMMAHPGKKLVFMGGEFGQFIEWRDSEELDWVLNLYPMHQDLKQYVKALNTFYKNEKAFWELDHTHEGFEWIDHQNYEQSIISFMRKGKNPEDFTIIICNFTPVVQEEYKIGVPMDAQYVEVLNSDCAGFGGSNIVNNSIMKAVDESWNNQDYHITIKVPPLAAIYIKPYMEYSTKKVVRKLTKED